MAIEVVLLLADVCALKDFESVSEEFQEFKLRLYFFKDLCYIMSRFMATVLTVLALRKGLICAYFFS